MKKQILYFIIAVATTSNATSMITSIDDKKKQLSPEEEQSSQAQDAIIGVFSETLNTRMRLQSLRKKLEPFKKVLSESEQAFLLKTQEQVTMHLDNAKMQYDAANATLWIKGTSKLADVNFCLNSAKKLITSANNLLNKYEEKINILNKHAEQIRNYAAENPQAKL